MIGPNRGTLTGNARGAKSIASAAVGFRLLVAALIFIGVAFRAAPLLDQDGRLMNAPNDDGYLMLTIARNLATGKGFTVSDGNILTNGTQPLATLVDAGVFVVTSADRRSGIEVLLVLQMIAACLAAIGLRRLAISVLGERDDRKIIADLAAAAWFASAVTVRHTINFLETGMYALAIVLVALAVYKILASAEENPGYLRFARLGALLGVAFWVRNDAVFLILATCLALILDGFRTPETRARGWYRAFLVGITAVVVAAPWLWFNHSRFGSIVPVSGRAETLEAAQSIFVLPSVLTSYFLMVSPVPNSVQDKPVVIGLCLLVLAAAAIVIRQVWRSAGAEQRRFMGWAGLYCSFLVLFYGFFFGVPTFLSRFMFPLSPFLALLWAVAVVKAWRWSEQRGLGRVTQLAAASLCAITLGLHIRGYHNLRGHLQLQMLRWVNKNVPERIWIGAVQSGTLGFFHDRTINLDGKVNPAAFQARLNNRIGEYMVATPVEYLVDWVGLLDYYRVPKVRENFEIIVKDSVQNLAVMKRRNPESL